MRFRPHPAASCALFAIFIAPAAFAASPVTVVFGTSWDPPASSLQNIVDARYGAGNINVQTDYLGHHAGDPDPWFWVDGQVSALLIREVAGNAYRNLLGWYEEPQTLAPPVIDGVNDGVVFDGPANDGSTRFILFDHPTRFGFYMNPNGPYSSGNAPEPELFYSNRYYNDRGPNGSAALHTPLDGDVQALVFDVSAWTRPNTWLVCFEDIDSGPNPTPCCDGTDNDFNDMVFEVVALGATPTLQASFGQLKARYR
ncbi:MAG: DUF4114 domain-containing protein [Candidatus Eisenbacteria bacterium]|uniref:DUF4114 domain-containing protein n=1 Tax=Eiseniibacteriota bacterium TaxID=2212470 RepID=A0A849SFU0_UNCEI|nr:DUF4114 domain-containing protein [Candidatus Eisenbacteria bacterium]